jgi:hypothetical protein
VKRGGRKETERRKEGRKEAKEGRVLKEGRKGTELKEGY